jgi:hypothetical protein
MSEGVIRRIAMEMEKVGFDKVEIDPKETCSAGWEMAIRLSPMIAISTQLALATSTTGKFDPYKGFETETEIGGRGGLTRKAASFPPCMVQRS